MLVRSVCVVCFRWTGCGWLWLAGYNEASQLPIGENVGMLSRRKGQLLVLRWVRWIKGQEGRFGESCTR